MNVKHPEQWFRPFRPVESPKLANDETIGMAMMFTLQHEGKDVAHAIFSVIRKGNKAIGRNILCHVNDTGFCAGHADDAAEYDISEESTLIEETRNQTLEFVTRTMFEKDSEITVDKDKPLYYMQVQKGQTNAEVLHHMLAHQDPAGDLAKDVIIQTLGLEDNSPNLGIPGATMTVAPEINEKKVTNNLVKAAEEMALIKKFGKKHMESLAKKINYSGEIINKTKKTHAK